MKTVPNRETIAVAASLAKDGRKPKELTMADIAKMESQVTALEAQVERLQGVIAKANAAPDESGPTFQDVVEYITDRDRCSRTDALRKARKEAPEMFAEWQQGTTTKAENFQTLVDREVAKGCSPAVAAQRVGLMHPELAESVVEKKTHAFDDVVDQIAKSEKCSRSEAMSIARKRNPKAFAAYQAR